MRVALSVDVPAQRPATSSARSRAARSGSSSSAGSSSSTSQDVEPGLATLGRRRQAASPRVAAAAASSARALQLAQVGCRRGRRGHQERVGQHACPGGELDLVAAGEGLLGRDLGLAQARREQVGDVAELRRLEGGEQPSLRLCAAPCGPRLGPGVPSRGHGRGPSGRGSSRGRPASRLPSPISSATLACCRSRRSRHSATRWSARATSAIASSSAERCLRDVGLESVQSAPPAWPARRPPTSPRAGRPRRGPPRRWPTLRRGRPTGRPRRLRADSRCVLRCSRAASVVALRRDLLQQPPPRRALTCPAPGSAGDGCDSLPHTGHGSPSASSPASSAAIPARRRSRASSQLSAARAAESRAPTISGSSFSAATPNADGLSSRGQRLQRLRPPVVGAGPAANAAR